MNPFRFFISGPATSCTEISSACPLEARTKNTPILSLSSNAQLLKLTLNGRQGLSSGRVVDELGLRELV